MRLKWAVPVVLLMILLFLFRRDYVRYEYLDFVDTSFTLGSAEGSAVLRGSFSDEVDRLVQKTSPYTLLISLPGTSSPQPADASWSLEQLVLKASASGEIILGPIDLGERPAKTDGGEWVYFTVSDHQ